MPAPDSIPLTGVSYVHRSSLKAFASWSVLLLFSGPILAQTGVGTFGTILGTVTDSTGAVIPGVTVTVTNEQTGMRRTVTTDGQGRFHVPSLLSSVYTVQAELTGFRKFVQKDRTFFFAT